jgi:hypothetical protein
MTRDRSGRGTPGAALARKVILTGATGLLTFVVSGLLDGPLDVPLSQQLVLSTLVGGVTLLTQFLAEFDQRVRELEDEQAENLVEARQVIDTGFTRISDATAFFALLEASALRTDALTEFLRRAGRRGAARPALLIDLAHHEIERVTSLLRSLSEGHEVFYDGEDREWLLGLARSVRQSIDATSLATVDAGRSSFEGGLWTNDLGRRYLDLQRGATRRGVRIRRIFIFDGSPGLSPEDFDQIYQLQLAAGVDVKTLDSSTVPLDQKSLVFDFVVFDKVLSYDTIPASRIDPTGKPGILTTRLIFEAEPVQARLERFEALWHVARPVRPLPTQAGPPEGQ